MKTKSEILGIHEDKNEMHFHEVDRTWIFEAMSEYAKQEAQEFAEWCAKNDWKLNEVRNEWFNIEGIGSNCTTSELYTKFDEERSKQ